MQKCVSSPELLPSFKSVTEKYTHGRTVIKVVVHISPWYRIGIGSPWARLIASPSTKLKLTTGVVQHRRSISAATAG